MQCQCTFALVIVLLNSPNYIISLICLPGAEFLSTAAHLCYFNTIELLFISLAILKISIKSNHICFGKKTLQRKSKDVFIRMNNGAVEG